ncbi:hypothetical protein LSH36_888g00018, partial [Paralvinella palmiformis]
DISYRNAILDSSYLDNNNLAIVTVGGLQVFTKYGEKVNHPLLGGRGMITMFDNEVGGSLKDRCVETFAGVSVNTKEDVVAMTERRSDQGYLNIWHLVANNWQFNRYEISHRPWHVAILSNGQYVIAGFNCYRYKYNESCKMIWCKTSCDVLDITVDNTIDSILIIDGNKFVLFLDSSSDVLLSISLSASMLKPRGLSVDKEGNLVICKGESNPVLLFNNQYQFVRKLVIRNLSSYRIALCDNKYLTICDKRSKVVYTYCTDNNSGKREINNLVIINEDLHTIV